jgi:hypothetical protein
MTLRDRQSCVCVGQFLCLRVGVCRALFFGVQCGSILARGRGFLGHFFRRSVVGSNSNAWWGVCLNFVLGSIGVNSISGGRGVARGTVF